MLAYLLRDHQGIREGVLHSRKPLRTVIQYTAIQAIHHTALYTPPLRYVRPLGYAETMEERDDVPQDDAHPLTPPIDRHVPGIDDADLEDDDPLLDNDTSDDNTSDDDCSVKSAGSDA